MIQRTAVLFQRGLVLVLVAQDVAHQLVRFGVGIAVRLGARPGPVRLLSLAGRRFLVTGKQRELLGQDTRAGESAPGFRGPVLQVSEALAPEATVFEV